MSEYTTQTDSLQQDVENNLKKHMHSNGLFCEAEIVWDGRKHKYNANSHKSYGEWYYATELREGVFICTYGTFREDQPRFTFRSYEKHDFPEELNFIKECDSKILEAERANLVERKIAVQKEYGELSSCGPSSYLEAKLLCIENVKIKDDFVYVPAYDLDGDFVTYQKIPPKSFHDQNKKFAWGIPSKGTFHPMGDIITSKEIIICEGYATGLSINKSTDSYTAVAFGAFNIVSTGIMFKNRYPDKKISLAADNDDAGRKTAEEWKSSINGNVYFPKLKDFSDDFVEFGKDAVKKLFPPKLRAQSLAEIVAEKIRLDQKLNDLITEGSITVIYGSPGIGKSRVTTEMALSIATGVDFLSFKHHKKARVLFLDGELSATDIQLRTIEMLTRYSVDKDGVEIEINPEDFKLVKNDTFNEMFDTDIDLFNNDHRLLVAELFQDFDLLVLDNFNSLTNMCSETESSDVIHKKKSNWKSVFKWLKQFRTMGKAVIIVAHTTKDGADMQGVSEIKADVTSVLKLRKPKGCPNKSSDDPLQETKYGNMLADMVIEYEKARAVPLYLQVPIRASLFSDKPSCFGWKHNLIKPDSKE